MVSKQLLDKLIYSLIKFEAMDITLHYTKLFEMLVKASEMGSKNTLTKLGVIKPLMTKKEAYELFNQPAVDRAIKERTLKTVKKGGKTSNVYIVRAEFYKWLLEDELLSKAINSL